MSERGATAKSAEAYRTISEVAEELKLPQHVLRFWETRFPQVKPLKRAGGRRFYRPEDVTLLGAVKTLLYDEGYTIKGVQRMLQEHGPRGLAAGLDAPPRSRSQAPPVAVAQGAARGPQPVPPPLSPQAAPPLLPAAVADPTDPIARLEAVALDLSECERLLGAFRDA